MPDSPCFSRCPNPPDISADGAPGAFPGAPYVGFTCDVGGSSAYVSVLGLDADEQANLAYRAANTGGTLVLTARLSGQQVMINGNALYSLSPSRLRLLSARNRGPVGAPTARRGRTTWTAARMSAISRICPLAVAKTVRWPSQKVTGLPGPLRRHSAPNADYLRLL